MAAAAAVTAPAGGRDAQYGTSSNHAGRNHEGLDFGLNGSSSPHRTTTTTTTTVNAYPPRISSQAVLQPEQAYAGHYRPRDGNYMSRRSLSQSTNASADGALPVRTVSNVSSYMSRNPSTRSGTSLTDRAGGQGSSYVALMRRQKATVWCDRAQHEDPRMLAQQKAAKIRATREITNGPDGRNSTSGNSSLGVRSKIRHHGVPKATGFNSANLVGGGVPMRLSANEVGDEITTEDGRSAGAPASPTTTSTHARHSSAQSRHQSLLLDTNHRSGQGSSDPGPNTSSPDCFSPATGASRASSEREDSFGQLPALVSPPSSTKPIEGKTAEDLRRRGSVDERANTLGGFGGVGARLFVVNPDLDD